MEVLIVTIAVSLALVVAAVLFLAQRIKQGDVEHGDRLSLLPLEDDAAPETARDRDAKSTVQDDSRGRERPETGGKTPGPRHQA